MILSLALVSGCSDKTPTWVKVNQNTLKFRAGDTVKQINGFYSECKLGVIVDFMSLYQAEKSPTYAVKFFCNGLGFVIHNIDEDNLKKVEN